MGDYVKKPPLGVLNNLVYRAVIYKSIVLNGGMCEKYISSKRKDDLRGAITRYLKHDKEIPQEWIVEFNNI